MCFPNEFPFQVDDKQNIKNYYYDNNKEFPRYKLENKPEGYRLTCERLPNYTRTNKYIIKNVFWNKIEDVSDNNFKSLVEHIINNNISINIDGRAGTGKSTLIKQIQEEMDKREIQCKSLAYTNKACRIINGTTIHKFIKTMSSKALQEMNVKYIIVDEISMVPEIFYKYFTIIKKFRPDIKFIIAGDYAQLLPVKDRIGIFDYKNSWCLNEIVDGNRLQLTKCRRSDDTLFNMLLPENIGKIQPSDFKNKITERHISFTNERRIKINKAMMRRKAKTNKYLELNKLDYDDNSQDVKLIKDTPIIARKNYKELDIFNNEQFIIKNIEFDKENIIIISDIDEEKVINIPFDMFTRLFYPAYAITIYKSQGSTFDYPFTIHEWHHGLFNDRLRYVALSRSTTIDNINIYV